MHVLFLTHRLPYAPNRGDRIRAYHLLRHLSTFADVSLFSLVHDDEEASRARTMKVSGGLRTARVSRARNLVRGALRLGTRAPLTHALLDARGAVETLADQARQQRPDLVLAYCSGMARFAFSAPLASLPLVLDMVDVDSAKWAQLGERSAQPRRWIYRREASTLSAFEAEAARRAKATLVVNERERDLMLALAPDSRVHVVPNGIDLEAFSPSGPPANDPVVVFCGMMSYAPNVEGVLWFVERVWPAIRTARPEAKCLIVGAEPPAAIQELATRNLAVEITGAVPAVQPFLWRSAVAIAPLHVARGLQNKVLEALAAGLPVVGTPAVINGLPHQARIGCIEAADDRTFAEGVLSLLALAPESRRARARAADLGALQWPQQLRSLEGILEDALR